MSLALKKNNFRVQIRRQNLSKILKHKKQQYYNHIDVNEAIIQYLDRYQEMPLPKICALKYELIDQEHLIRLIQLVKLDKIRLNIAKPQQISLLNKMILADSSLILKYFDEVTDFAEKVIFTVEHYYKDIFGDSLINQAVKIPSTVIEEAIYLPNCLLEFWAKFFSVTEEDHNISLKGYCTILRAFIFWFSSKSFPHQNFSKYSVCLFLHNFFLFERIYMTGNNQKNDFYQFDQLYIRFRIACMPIVLNLLEEEFFCEELLTVVEKIISRDSLSEDFLRSINARQCTNLFNLLLSGLDNQDLLIFKEDLIEKRFFCSKNLTKNQLQTLSELSVEKILIKDVSQSIWKCKMNLLDIFNGFLSVNVNGYANLLWNSDIEQIIEKLVKTYIYCTERGDITSQIQKTICIIFYNILLLIQTEPESLEDTAQCLKILTEAEQNIQERLRNHFIENLSHLSQIISKTQYTSYDHAIELISFLSSFSEFIYTKEVDDEIMIEGRLLRRICEAVKENFYNKEEIQKILASLFEFLQQLSDKSFDFSQIVNDLMELQEARFDHLLTEKQEEILMEILRPFERQDSNETN